MQDILDLLDLVALKYAHPHTTKVPQLYNSTVGSVGDFNRIVGRMKSGDTVLVYAKRQNSNFFTAFQLP